MASIRAPLVSNDAYAYPESDLEPYHQQTAYYPEPTRTPEPTQQPYYYSDPREPILKKEAGEGTPPKQTILGLKRKNFWILLALGLTIVIVGVLLGLLGASLSGTLKGSSSSETTPTPTSSASATTTSASPAIATAKGPGGVSIECPSADGRNYSAPNSSKVFKRVCGYDFNGDDIFNVTATNMQECMDACAARSGCLAVTWVFEGVQGKGSNYCWVKRSQASKIESPFVESAYLL